MAVARRINIPKPNHGYHCFYPGYVGEYKFTVVDLCLLLYLWLNSKRVGHCVRGSCPALNILDPQIHINIDRYNKYKMLLCRWKPFKQLGYSVRFHAVQFSV